MANSKLVQKNKLVNLKARQQKLSKIQRRERRREMYKNISMLWDNFEQTNIHVNWSPRRR